MARLHVPLATLISMLPHPGLTESMPEIMDVYVAAFQLRNELMIDHFKQLIIIYAGGYGKV